MPNRCAPGRPLAAVGGVRPDEPVLPAAAVVGAGEEAMFEAVSLAGDATPSDLRLAADTGVGMRLACCERAGVAIGGFSAEWGETADTPESLVGEEDAD